MQSRTLMCVFAITLFTALALPVPLAAQEQKKEPPRYTITDLGTLGGTFSDVGGVNNQGAISGFSTLPGDTVTHAFLWQRGQMTDLGTSEGQIAVRRKHRRQTTGARWQAFRTHQIQILMERTFVVWEPTSYVSRFFGKRCDDAAAHAR